MKQITIIVQAGNLNLDFEGFSGRACEDEAEKIRILYAKLGIQTAILSDSRKAEVITNGEREYEQQ